MSKRKPARAPVKAGPPANHLQQRSTRKVPLWPRRRRLGWALAAGVLIAVAVVIALSARGRSGAPATTAGAPEGAFTTTSGATETISSLHGRPALLWFVTTWCSSCQAGTQAMASQISHFAALGVRVVELENADDLGQSGPSITAFARQLAGAAYRDTDWTWGAASSSLTGQYNPHGYLDIYYLLDARGRVVYVNSSPAATMRQLLGKASKLSART